MPASARSDFCVWACRGVGGLVGLALFVVALAEVPVLAAAMAGAMLAVLAGLAVSRAVCPEPGPRRKSEARDATAAPVETASQASDLKKIKGLGPKLEALCHAMGIHRFDQIAAWGPDDLARLDARQPGLAARIRRDRWVAQARALDADAKTARQKRGKNDGDGAA